MAEFKLSIKCMWNSETGDFEKLTEGEEDEGIEEDDGDESE